MILLTNDEIEELVGLDDTSSNMLKARDHDLLLTDKQVGILERYNINVADCKSMEELIYKLNDISREEDDELDYLLDQLTERNYYENIRQ